MAGIDFNAEPSPEGLALAAQLRREREQRDKTQEDRIVESQVRDLDGEARTIQSRTTSPDQVVQQSEAEGGEPRQRRDAAQDVREPGGPSPQEILAARASMLKSRRIDRQR